MKRRLTKSIVAVAVCTAMLGMTCQAAASATSDLTTPGGAGTEVEGENAVENPVYKITVPTKLEFAVDAFEQKGDGQIVSKDLTVINKSNVPVKIGIDIKLSTTKGVVFAATPDEVADDDSTKSVYMEARIADSVTETKATPGKYKKADGSEVTNAFKSTAVEGNYYLTNAIAQTVEGLGAVPTYSDATTEMVDVASLAVTYPATAEDIVKYALGTEATKISFALDAADYINWYGTDDSFDRLFKTTAANNEGSASYRFAGAVNPNVTWADKDFKATAQYSFSGMATSKYDALTPVANAHQLLITDETPAFTSTTKGVISFTPGSGKDALKSITKIEMVNKGTTYDGFNAFAGGWEAATVDNVAGTITFDGNFIKFFTVDTEATITYVNAADESVTTKLTVKCTT